MGTEFPDAGNGRYRLTEEKRQANTPVRNVPLCKTLCKTARPHTPATGGRDAVSTVLPPLPSGKTVLPLCILPFWSQKFRGLYKSRLCRMPEMRSCICPIGGSAAVFFFRFGVPSKSELPSQMSGLPQPVVRLMPSRYGHAGLNPFARASVLIGADSQGSKHRILGLKRKERRTSRKK